MEDRNQPVTVDLLNLLIMLFSMIFLITLVSMDHASSEPHCVPDKDRADAGILADVSNPLTVRDCTPTRRRS